MVPENTELPVTERVPVLVRPVPAMMAPAVVMRPLPEAVMLVAVKGPEETRPLREVTVTAPWRKDVLATVRVPAEDRRDPATTEPAVVMVVEPVMVLAERVPVTTTLPALTAPVVLMVPPGEVVKEAAVIAPEAERVDWAVTAPVRVEVEVTDRVVEVTVLALTAPVAVSEPALIGPDVRI